MKNSCVKNLIFGDIFSSAENFAFFGFRRKIRKNVNFFCEILRSNKNQIKRKKFLFREKKTLMETLLIVNTPPPMFRLTYCNLRNTNWDSNQYYFTFIHNKSYKNGYKQTEI